MNERGKSRFRWELEKFIITRLRRFPIDFYNDDNIDVENTLINVEERFRVMDKIWERYEWWYSKNWSELADFPQLTNHEMCHEMFKNAFKGYSKMYIQMQDLRFNNDAFFYRSNEIMDGNEVKEKDENEVITLQCSLLTLQMLDYDIMMFRAMEDIEDEEYRSAALKYYRPYLFSYVIEISREKYKELQYLQNNIVEPERTSVEEETPSPYLWMECTFNPNRNVQYVEFDGYVVQSASSINKIKAKLSIVENGRIPIAVKKSILDGYKLNASCLKDDISFINLIENKLGHGCLSSIDVYKIGNGNCVFAQDENHNMSFFYDIGFNYRHRPKKISPGVHYNYSATMRKIYAKKPSFFILSHWDMDHIAGSVAARKDFFEKDWFAPDCYDACMDAWRLAKYLDMKDHLFLAERSSRNGTLSGRLIGRQINIENSGSSSTILATYRLYMGERDKCDRSLPNCEGIVIEYNDVIKNEKVLMMGDVNYASFNKARSVNKDAIFANTQIDYLIAPHHGSEHTAYKQIIGSGKVLWGAKAIICCTNEPNKNRPNDNHRKELEKRFDEVITTEEITSKKTSIRISL